MPSATGRVRRRIRTFEGSARVSAVMLASTASVRATRLHAACARLRAMSDLEALIAEVARNDQLGQNEATTRFQAVDPILMGLGWPRNDIVPEYSVRDGKVDYCLRGNGRNLVLIEAKRAGTDLTGHQELLLRCALDEGAPLAALTDGLTWWLYLTRADGDWEQWRFSRIDLRSQDAASAATHLGRFLGKDNVTSGSAVEAAQREFDNRERDRRVRVALDATWRQVLGDPDGLLIDLVAEAVETETGHRPDDKTVHQFLLGKISQNPDASPAAEPPDRNGKEATDTDQTDRVLPPDADFTGRRPAAFWLDGGRHETANWQAVLSGVCELLVAEAGLRRFAEAVTPLKGKTRAYFNRDRDLLRTAVPIAGGDFFIEGNFSANDQVRHARSVLIAVRGPQGAGSFGIETTE